MLPVFGTGVQKMPHESPIEIVFTWEYVRFVKISRIQGNNIAKRGGMNKINARRADCATGTGSTRRTRVGRFGSGY